MEAQGLAPLDYGISALLRRPNPRLDHVSASFPKGRTVQPVVSSFHLCSWHLSSSLAIASRGGKRLGGILYLGVVWSAGFGRNGISGCCSVFPFSLRRRSLRRSSRACLCLRHMGLVRAFNSNLAVAEYVLARNSRRIKLWALLDSFPGPQHIYVF